MTRTNLATLALALLVSAAVARADTADDHIARAREAHTRGDYAHARDELLAAYRLDARPALLFALGQMELNLGNFQQAIDYYEKFKETNPPTDQLALAEQAIGAARIELQRPPKPDASGSTTNATPSPPPKPRPPPHREWDATDAVIAAIGGAALIGGVISISVAVELPNQGNSTLHTYEARANDAFIARDLGVAGIAVGAVAAGGALLRWRLHLVDATVEVEPTRGGVAVQVGGKL